MHFLSFRVWAMKFDFFSDRMPIQGKNASDTLVLGKITKQLITGPFSMAPIYMNF